MAQVPEGERAVNNVNNDSEDTSGYHGISSFGDWFELREKGKSKAS